jgi:hypothetical protein
MRPQSIMLLQQPPLTQVCVFYAGSCTYVSACFGARVVQGSNADSAKGWVLTRTVPGLVEIRAAKQNATFEAKAMPGVARAVVPLQSVQGHAGLWQPGDCDKASDLQKVTATTAASTVRQPVSSHALLLLRILSVPSYAIVFLENPDVIKFCLWPNAPTQKPSRILLPIAQLAAFAAPPTLSRPPPPNRQAPARYRRGQYISHKTPPP